jgi:hypothetical protein
LPAADYAYLLGFYLGDGTISRGRKRVFKLRIFTDLRYRAVIAECMVAMAAVMPSSRVGIHRHGPGECAEIHSHSRAWPCLIPQYGPGPKHERRIELTDWQQHIVARRPHQFVRGLIHSDGCRITNWATTPYGRYEYPRYLFSQVSEDIKELFCISLEQLGVEYTWPKWNTVSIARADSVRLLDQFVGPKS